MQKYTIKNTHPSSDFLFFWGHTPKNVGTVDKSCLSQWYEAPFEVDRITYRTAEHWMMAHKAKLFNDTEMLVKILTARTPHEAKALGRKVRGFNAEAWEAKAFEIVVDGNYHKFAQNSVLLKFLHATGAKVLVEASPYDKIWGIGLTQDDKLAQDPRTWQGTNLLGFALMEVRDTLS